MKTIHMQFSDLNLKLHTPVFSYCRKLLAKGEAPDTILKLYRGEQLDLTVIVGKGAELTVREDPSPHFVKYRQPSFKEGVK